MSETTTSPAPEKTAHIPAGLFALALDGFGIGLTEFVVTGFLPDIAGQLHITEAAAFAAITPDRRQPLLPTIGERENTGSNLRTSQFGTAMHRVGETFTPPWQPLPLAVTGRDHSGSQWIVGTLRKLILASAAVGTVRASRGRPRAANPPVLGSTTNAVVVTVARRHR